MEFRRRIGQLLVAAAQEHGLQQMNVGRTLLRGQPHRGRARPLRSERAHPARQDAAAARRGRHDPRPGVRSERFHPSQATQILSQRIGKDASQGSIFSSLLEMKDFVTGLPLACQPDPGRGRQRRARGQGEARSTRSWSWRASRRSPIASRSGLILAALIVGASLLMRVETSFRLFGYPGLAMLCFLAAAAGGFWLVVHVAIKDYKDRHDVRR